MTSSISLNRQGYAPRFRPHFTSTTTDRPAGTVTGSSTVFTPGMCSVLRTVAVMGWSVGLLTSIFTPFSVQSEAKARLRLGSEA